MEAVRQERRARDSGATVALIDAAHPDASSFDPAEGGRWVTFCDDHGQFVQHTTLALARAFASRPSEWCSGCRPAT